MTGTTTSDVGCNDAGKVLNNTILIKQLKRVHLLMTNVEKRRYLLKFKQNTFNLLQKHTKTAKPAMIYAEMETKTSFTFIITSV